MTNPHANPIKPWLWLIPALLISCAAAVPMLNQDLLFVDEYWSIRNSAGLSGFDMGEIWHRTAYVDPGGMGVFYHWTLGAWEALTGATAFSTRTFSLLWGVIAIALVYRLGAALLSARIGLYAALILASSAFFIDYMHEARAYTMVVALSVLFVLCYVQVSRRPHPIRYAMLSLSLAALIYTHYVTLAMGAVVGLYHLLNFRSTRRWWLITAALAVGGLMFLPWVEIMFGVVKRGTQEVSRQVTSMSNPALLHELFSVFSNHNLALLALLVGGALYTRRKTALLWIWAVVAVLLVLIVNHFIPFMVHLRYLLFVFPALALIAAVGLTRFKQFAPALLIVWMGAGYIQSQNPAFIAETFGQIYRAPAAGFHTMLDTLEQRAQDDDLVMLHFIPHGFEPFNYFPLDFYLVETPQIGGRLRFDQYQRMNNSFAQDDAGYKEDVLKSLDGAQAVWAGIVPEVPKMRFFDVAQETLNEHFAYCETVLSRDDMQLALYARMPQGRPDVRLGALRLYDLNRGVQTADTLHLVTGWRIEADVPPNVYSVAFHLFDAQGNFVSQHDTGLPNERPFGCMAADVPLMGLAAGTYTLRVKVYAWETGVILHDYVDFKTVQVRD